MARPQYDPRVCPKAIRARYGGLKGPDLARLYIEIRYLLFGRNPRKVSRELRAWDEAHPNDSIRLKI